ncbi:hypothetical protein HNV12_11845 [Methanococcoides sp. SA1]|nr:hypothetical protein [Methanococcoides sp. SA1]
MIKEIAVERIADFIRGRVATTIDSEHYLNKVEQAKK